MTRPIIAYAVTYGLAGCYLPDSVSGPLYFTRRRDLAAAIRDELAFYEMPLSLAREAGLRRLWPMLQRRGASSYHLSFIHKGKALTFSGLTEAEAREMESALD